MEEMNTDEFAKKWREVNANTPWQIVNSYDHIHWLLETLKATEPFLADEVNKYFGTKPIFEGEQRELLKNKLIELLK